MSLPTRPRARTPLHRGGVAACALQLVIVAGCATVGPDFRPAVPDAPPDWSSRHGGDGSLAAPPSASAALPADRWAVFGDAELLRLLALARRANPDLHGAALRLLQSRVAQTGVSAQRGLQLGAKVGLARQQQSEYGSASRLVGAIGGPNKQQLLDALSSPFTLYQAGFDASWEPDLWGRVLRSEEAAQAGTDGQQAALRQVQLSVAAEVARAYFGLRSAQHQRRLLQDTQEAAQETEALLAAKVRTGLADESALTRQRAQLAGLAALVPPLLAQEAQAMNRITLLCGAAPGTLNDALAAGTAQPVAITLPDLRLGLPGEVARHRPDIAAAEARLHAATAAIGIAIADLYPRITLGASFGLEAVGSTRFGQWGSRQWTLGPSLSIPIFDQGRRQATIMLRELQQQEAAVAFQQAVLRAWHEVDDAISTYLAETRRDAQLQARAQRADDEAALARARYGAGLTDYLPVLTAAIGAIEVRRELADSELRRVTSLVALYKSLGDSADAPVDAAGAGS